MKIEIGPIIIFSILHMQNAFCYRRSPTMVGYPYPPGKERAMPMRVPDRNLEDFWTNRPYNALYEGIPQTNNIQFATPNIVCPTTPVCQPNYIEIPYQKYLEMQMPTMPAPRPLVLQMPAPIPAPIPSPIPAPIPVQISSPMPAQLPAPLPVQMPILVPQPPIQPMPVTIPPLETPTPLPPCELPCESEVNVCIPEPVLIPERRLPTSLVSPYLPAASPISPWISPASNLPPMSSGNSRSNFLRKIPIPPPTL